MEEKAKTLVKDSGVQASVLLTIGSGVWKLVSIWSNVTFLVSIRQENFAVMFQFLQSTGWWILLAIGIVWLLTRATHPNPTTAGPGWTMVGVFSVLTFMFGALIAVRSAASVPNVIGMWGGNADTCQVALDTSRLIPFQSKYKIAEVCGITDPHIEKLDDNRITVSSPSLN